MALIDYPVTSLVKLSTTTEYSSYLVESKQVNSVAIGIPTDGYYIFDLAAVVQYIVKGLLTEIGTNIYAPDRGTSLLTLVGKVITQDILRTVTLEVNNMLDTLIEEITELQDKYPPDNGNELVEELILQGINFDPTSGALSVNIHISTSNDQIPILIEV